MEITYTEAQESYMDTIHLPDSHQANTNWEKTLYAPLRNFVGNCLSNNKNKKSVLYLGCGPKAPLFKKSDNECAPLINHFDKICLSDYSLKYLQESKKAITPHFSNKSVDIKHTDITAGLSDFFFYWLSNVLTETTNKNSLYCQINFLNQHIGYFTDMVLKEKTSGFTEKYHCVYSEMVATYTGIPALVYSEKVLNNYCDKKIINQGDLTDLKNLLFNIWQQYNDRVLEFHIKNLLNCVEDEGSVILATDIEKIYNDPKKHNIKSLSEGVNIENIISGFSGSLSACVKSKKNIEWDDSVRNTNMGEEDYLDPHVHEVLLVCIQKKQGEHLEY